MNTLKNCKQNYLNKKIIGAASALFLLSACKTTGAAIVTSVGISMCAVPMGQAMITSIQTQINEQDINNSVYENAGIMCLAGITVMTMGVIMSLDQSAYDNDKIHVISCTEKDKSGCANDI